MCVRKCGCRIRAVWTLSVRRVINADMADLVNPVELRKLVLKWSRGPSGGTVEDADFITLHFAKLTGGVADANWLTADYTAVEARIDTLMTTLKTYLPSFSTFVEMRWFKDGPTQSPADGAPGPANPAVRVTARALAMTGALPVLPPQTSCSVTFKTALRKRWGRVFLPAFVVTAAAAVLTSEGRVATTTQAAMRGIFVTFFNGCRADAHLPVVWSRERSAHLDSKGNEIPHHDPTAYEITAVQVDNLYDVVRSRRYSGPTSRDVVALI